jgi:ankyrin repeat protein
MMAYAGGENTLVTEFLDLYYARSKTMTSHSEARLSKGGPLRPQYVLTFLTLFCPLSTWAGYPMPTQGTCQTPLISAIERRDSDEAKKLIDSGVDLNAKDCNGSTALIESIVQNQLEVSEKLVLAGANPNLASDKNTSPLIFASWYCRQQIVPLLLTHGAEVNGVDEDGYSPLMDSVQNCPDGGLAALLLRAGAKVNLIASDGNSALSTAAFYGNENAVHVLVAAGANLAARTKEGETALTIARDRAAGRTESHDRIYAFLCALQDL